MPFAPAKFYLSRGAGLDTKFSPRSRAWNFAADKILRTGKILASRRALTFMQNTLMSLRHLQNFKTAQNSPLQTVIAPRTYLRELGAFQLTKRSYFCRSLNQIQASAEKNASGECRSKYRSSGRVCPKSSPLASSFFLKFHRLDQTS